MNPELLRYIWLEFSLHRLIAMPGVLILVFLLAHTASAESGAGSAKVLAGMAIGFFALIVGLWGTRLAADSVTREANEHTWDGQRLSALSPWSMTWGKLFGAPVFTWYGGLFCLAVLLAAAPSDWPAGRYALLLVAAALLLHALGLLFSLLATRHEAVRERRMPGLLVVFLLLFGVLPLLGRVMDTAGSQQLVYWWGGAFPRLDFLLVSAAAFAAWAVFGACRLMCRELQVRTTPVAWVAFALFAIAYLTGFLDTADFLAGVERAGLLGWTGLLLNLGLTYLMLFAERSDAPLVRRLLLSAEARQWRRVLEELPCWPVSLLLAGISGLMMALYPLEFAGGLSNIFLPPLPLLLLAVRDSSLYLFFSFGRPRRSWVEGATLLYLLVLYWILPSLLRAMGAETLAKWVLPSFWERESIVFSSVILFLQAALAVALTVSRWRLENAKK
ncbi:MAG TPA: hypothetical protein VI457_16495 [Methylococcaceae bacterium]|nr:hypothetical protein [Methylococcaceae bacterium]